MWTLSLFSISASLVVAAVFVPPARGLFAVFAVFFFIFGIFGLVLKMLARAVLKNQAESQDRLEQVRSNFHDAQVTLVGLEDTGMTINNDPRVRVVLDVTSKGYSTTKLERVETISRVFMGMLAIDKVYKAKVDPDNGENVIVDWSGQLF